MLTERPATDIERKVIGASVSGLVTAIILWGLNRWAPDLVEPLGPHVEPFVVWAAASLGGYLTRSRQ